MLSFKHGLTHITQVNSWTSYNFASNKLSNLLTDNTGTVSMVQHNQDDSNDMRTAFLYNCRTFKVLHIYLTVFALNFDEAEFSQT